MESQVFHDGDPVHTPQPSNPQLQPPQRLPNPNMTVPLQVPGVPKIQQQDTYEPAQGNESTPLGSPCTGPSTGLAAVATESAINILPPAQLAAGFPQHCKI